MSSSLRLMLLQPPPSERIVSNISYAKNNLGFSTFACPTNLSSRKKWLCGYERRDESIDSLAEDGNAIRMFGSDEEISTQIPNQAQSLVEGSGSILVSEYKAVPDVDYLQVRYVIPFLLDHAGTSSNSTTRAKKYWFLWDSEYGIHASRTDSDTQLCVGYNRASGTNAAVIRGALRAERPELLTVILPQSLQKQSAESQELLSKVKNVIEKPYNDHLPLIEASRLCNMDIISQVQQVICFAFHDSRLLMETCQEAKNLRKIVTLFYLD